MWLLKVNDFIIFPLYKEHIQHSVIRALTSWAIDDDDDDVDDDDDDDDDNDDDELLPEPEPRDTLWVGRLYMFIFNFSTLSFVLGG